MVPEEMRSSRVCCLTACRATIVRHISLLVRHVSLLVRHVSLPLSSKIRDVGLPPSGLVLEAPSASRGRRWPSMATPVAVVGSARSTAVAGLKVRLTGSLMAGVTLSASAVKTPRSRLRATAATVTVTRTDLVMMTWEYRRTLDCIVRDSVE